MKKINTFLALALCVLLSTGMAFATQTENWEGPGYYYNTESNQVSYWPDQTEPNGFGPKEEYLGSTIGGPQGPPGPQGPMGPQGPQGLPGVPGQDGECKDCNPWFNGKTDVVVAIQASAAGVKLNVVEGDLLGSNLFAVAGQAGLAAFQDCNSGENYVDFSFVELPYDEHYGNSANSYGGAFASGSLKPIEGGVKMEAGAEAFTISGAGPMPSILTNGYNNESGFVAGVGGVLSGTNLKYGEVAAAQSLGAAGYMFVGQGTGYGHAITNGYSQIQALNGGISVQAGQVSSSSAVVGNSIKAPN